MDRYIGGDICVKVVTANMPMAALIMTGDVGWALCFTLNNTPDRADLPRENAYSKLSVLSDFNSEPGWLHQGDCLQSEYPTPGRAYVCYWWMTEARVDA